MGNSILHPTSTHLTYFWSTPLHKKWDMHEKTWCWHHHHVFSCISHFSWNGVHQKYVERVLVGCRIELPIQWLLPFEIWVKAHGDMLKIRVERVVFHFLIFFIFLHYYSIFYHFTLKNGDSSPMVDIINLNYIGSYKVDFCCTFLFWGPFFTSKFI